MIGKLKTLGLSLLVLAAIGAVSASAALAVTDVVTVGKSPALLTGVSHNNVFQRDAEGSTKVECTTSKFAATVKSGEPVVTVDVEYEGTLDQTPHTEKDCNASGGNATIDMNGCAYVLNGETTGKDISGKTDGTMWIECPEGKQIQMTSSLGLTLSIPAQTPTKGGTTVTNLASHAGNSALKVSMTATGITTTCSPMLPCALSGIPSHSNDYKYTGEVTVTAFEDIEGLPTSVSEGARVSVSGS